MRSKYVGYIDNIVIVAFLFIKNEFVRDLLIISFFECISVSFSLLQIKDIVKMGKGNDHLSCHVS